MPFAETVHALDLLTKLLSGGGQHMPFAVLLEKRALQRLFETLDPSADGGRIDLQQCRGAGELAKPGDGEEEAQIIPVHGCIYAGLACASNCCHACLLRASPCARGA